MGLYDTFCLKEPIPCTRCGKGEHKCFQTKEFECLMEAFYEGEPANYYALESVPEEERDSSGLPLFRGTDIVIGKIPDGIHSVYSYCPKCDALFYISVEIKDGIFTGQYKKE